MFTPGRWTYSDIGEGDVLVEAGGECIAVVSDLRNAALIAAAPELYETLRELRDRFGASLSDDGAGRIDRGVDGTLYAVDLILRKAEGITR